MSYNRQLFAFAVRILMFQATLSRFAGLAKQLMLRKIDVALFSSSVFVSFCLCFDFLTLFYAYMLYLHTTVNPSIINGESTHDV